MIDEKEQKHIFHSYVVGPIDDLETRMLMKDIDAANNNENVSSMVITVSSFGGHLANSFALFDYIKNSKKPIDMIAAGNCGSAAFMLMQAGRKRTSLKHTIFFVHPSTMQVRDSVPHDEFLLLVEQTNKDHELFVDLTIHRSKLSKERFQDLYNPRKYLSPEEAMEYGLIDEVV